MTPPRAVNEKPRPSPWPDGKDPAPDVFSVKWKGEKVLVKHYATIDAPRACCHVIGEISDADRTHEHGAAFALLERLEMPCGYR
jgi:hypothetical protein